MKWLTYILAIYFLGLSLVVCKDEFNGLQQANPETAVVVTSPPSGIGGLTAHDACTPVCTCSCCHVNITFPQLLTHQFSVVQSTVVKPVYPNDYKSLDLFEFFVPPRA